MFILSNNDVTIVKQISSHRRSNQWMLVHNRRVCYLIENLNQGKKVKLIFQVPKNHTN